MLLIVLLVAGFIFTMARSMGMREIETLTRIKEDYAESGQANAAVAVLIPSLAEVERYPLIPLLALQAFLLFVMGTAVVASGMTADGDEGTVDYVRLSPMTPMSKVMGYLFGLPIREWILFGVTLPFTAFALWRGQVPKAHWLPIYGVLVSAAILYHLTGLAAGTVLKNRRWAFLVSMGVIFLLYTVVPQLEKVGLIFFEYLTLWPVVTDNIHAFLSTKSGAMMKAITSLEPEVRFFGLGLSETQFTFFAQGFLILTFVVMLWRRWQRREAHLMSKLWAMGFSIWVQLVLLGCAIPLIISGLLFISQRMQMNPLFGRIRGGFRDSSPALAEGAFVIGVYGMVTMLMVAMLSILISPSQETQDRGAQRAKKLGLSRASAFSDEASAMFFTVAMSLVGGACWVFFAQRVLASHWFPGQELPRAAWLIYPLVILNLSLAVVALYEWRGPKGLFLGVVFVGIVPLMLAVIVAATQDDFGLSSIWTAFASPFVAPGGAVIVTVPDAIAFEGSQMGSVTAPRAFLFWLVVQTMVTVWLAIRARSSRVGTKRRIKD
jgi:hypothetical protein